MGYKRINQVYFMADTVEDLPNITGTLRMGAECFVIAESCEYKYTSDGQWIKQTIPSSGSGESVDLTGYATEEYVNTSISGLTTTSMLDEAIATLKGDAAFKILGENPDSFAIKVDASSGKTLYETMGEAKSGLYTCYVQKGVADNPAGSTSSCRGICCVNTWYKADSFYGWIILFDSDANCYTRYISVGDGISEWNKITQDLSGYVPIEKYENLKKESLHLSRLIAPAIKQEAKETSITINSTSSEYSGQTKTFDNIEFNISGMYSGYVGLTGTFNNCVFNGTLYLFGDTIFNNCEFNISGDEYNIWTYGGENITFNNCKFFSDGKALLVYGNENTNVIVENCTFFDNGGLQDLKAAIEIGDDWTTTKTLTVNNTYVYGYEINDKGIITGTTLWGNKNALDQDHLNVIVDGVDVY